MGSPSAVTMASSALGAPSSAITWEKVAAKTMMSMTMAVVRTVSWNAWFRVPHVRCPYQRASTRLTTVPSAAASVGVTTPKYIEPSTTKMRMATGATSRKELQLVPKGPAVLRHPRRRLRPERGIADHAGREQQRTARCRG